MDLLKSEDLSSKFFGWKNNGEILAVPHFLAAEPSTVLAQKFQKKCPMNKEQFFFCTMRKWTKITSKLAIQRLSWEKLPFFPYRIISHTSIQKTSNSLHLCVHCEEYLTMIYHRWVDQAFWLRRLKQLLNFQQDYSSDASLSFETSNMVFSNLSDPFLTWTLWISPKALNDILWLPAFKASHFGSWIIELGCHPKSCLHHRFASTHTPGDLDVAPKKWRSPKRPFSGWLFQSLGFWPLESHWQPWKIKTAMARRISLGK